MVKMSNVPELDEIPRLIEQGIKHITLNAINSFVDEVIETHVDEYRERLKSALKDTGVGKIQEINQTAVKNAFDDAMEIRISVKMEGLEDD